MHTDQEGMAQVTKALRKCLTEDRLTPQEAPRLCGKLVFRMFGMVGRAALSPLYARSHGGAFLSQHMELNQGLRAAITALLPLLA